MRSENYKDIYDIIQDLDFSVAELEDIENMFIVFDECLNREVEPITNDNLLGAAILTERLPLIFSTLNVLQMRFVDVVSDIKYAVGRAFDFARAE